MAATSCPSSPRASLRLTTKSSSTPRRDAGAIRVGDWKLVLNGSNGNGEQDDESPAPARRKKAARQNQPPKVELFNLAQDLSEKHDLSAEHPEKVKELQSRYDVLAKQAVEPRNQPKPPGYTAPKVWGEQE